ncbi:hypothetical protein RN51_01636 [Microbacterium oxydans]|uniref:Uncharacterized protein n=1 Tax=Microbacterium oxydans TaxID=82380 RepID=A0A0F0KUI2_9MICO|nr:hypothetical protein [Microbacterium oxydans]KJL22891.1 hypothetical protein RN51_01636 [Microbacterium oxydans]
MATNSNTRNNSTAVTQDAREWFIQNLVSDWENEVVEAVDECIESLFNVRVPFRRRGFVQLVREFFAINQQNRQMGHLALPVRAALMAEGMSEGEAEREIESKLVPAAARRIDDVSIITSVCDEYGDDVLRSKPRWEKARARRRLVAQGNNPDEVDAVLSSSHPIARLVVTPEEMDAIAQRLPSASSVRDRLVAEGYDSDFIDESFARIADAYAAGQRGGLVRV